MRVSPLRGFHVTANYFRGLAALDHGYLAVGDCFSGEGVLIPGLEAEHIASNVKRSDLPAPIDNVVSLDKPSVRDVLHAPVRG